MGISAGVLGQVEPAGTTNTSIYSPAAGVTARLTALEICNTTGGALTFRLFLDDDGTTYNTSTALRYGESVPANDSIKLDLNWWMNNSSGNLAAWISAAGLTFTLFGIESS